MNHEAKFFRTLALTTSFVEEMLCTGTDVDAVEELLFGSPQLGGSLPTSFSKILLPSSFATWLRRSETVDA